MENKQKQYLKLFDSSVYLPPNSIHNGYSLIAPLLYIYPQVIIHSPVSSLIVKSSISDPNTTPILEDFEKLMLNTDNDIKKPLIIPTAFDTFRDLEYRQNLPLEYRVDHEFDKQLINESSPLYNKFKIAPDIRLKNTKKAFEIVQQLPHISTNILNRLKMAKNQNSLSSYEKIYQMKTNYSREKTKFEPYKLILDHPNQNEQIVMLGMTSLFNNKVARYSSKSGTEIMTMEDQIVTELIAGIKPAFPNVHIVNNQLDLRIIMTIMKNISTKIEKRITIDDILCFRKYYRDIFLPDLIEILLQVEEQKYIESKIRIADELSKKSLTDYKFPRNIIPKLSRILSKFSFGFAREEEITNLCNKLLDIPKFTRTWNCTGLTNPTFPKIIEKSKNTIINKLNSVKDLKL